MRSHARFSDTKQIGATTDESINRPRPHPATGAGVFSIRHRPSIRSSMQISYCSHTSTRVRDLIATTSRLNTRAFRIPALVCCDCGETLITDSVQHINIILRMLETLGKRVSAVERASEANREADHHKIAA